MTPTTMSGALKRAPVITGRSLGNTDELIASNKATLQKIKILVYEENSMASLRILKAQIADVDSQPAKPFLGFLDTLSKKFVAKSGKWVLRISPFWGARDDAHRGT
jgi:hypothetical protein